MSKLVKELKAERKIVENILNHFDTSLVDTTMAESSNRWGFVKQLLNLASRWPYIPDLLRAIQEIDAYNDKHVVVWLKFVLEEYKVRIKCAK